MCYLVHCTNECFKESKYCEKHIYWDDLSDEYSEDLNQKIKNVITNHILLYINQNSRTPHKADKIKITNKMFRFLIHKPRFIASDYRFKKTILTKMQEFEGNDKTLDNTLKLFHEKHY